MPVPLPPGFRFYRELIREAATAAHLEPLLVAAVVWQESGFNSDAFRHEPGFWNRYLKANPKYQHLNPRRVSSSYGLMQTMYCRVLEDTMTDNDALPPEHLFVPEDSLRTGCQLLRELLVWAATKTDDSALIVRSALAAYNGGRGGNAPGNTPLRNEKYARETLAKFDILKKASAF